MRNAPGWTAIAMGVLLGFLIGAGWLLLQQRGGGAPVADLAGGSPPAAASGDAAGTGGEDRPQAGRTSAPDLDGGVVGDADAGGTAGGTAAPAAAADSPGSSRRTAIVRATERVAPAVVSINVVEHRTYRTRVPGGMEFWERFYPGLFPRREFRQDVQSLGSGVIVSEDGLVLTNHHVVEGADRIIVTLSDGRQVEAELLESVAHYDLALLRIPAQDLPVAPMAAADDLQIGEWAIAIGSPFGYLLADTQPTVTVGVISALNRDIKRTGTDRTYLGMIQTDASINPGNSGGPLIDANGEIVGINTFIFTESGGSIGIGFAVPIKRAQWLIEEVRRYGRYRQAYSGIYAQKLSANLVRALDLKDPVGFIIMEVEPESPAWKAGLRDGDILREINGVKLENYDTVTRLLYEAQVGTRLSFLAERDGEPFRGVMVLEEMQEHAPGGR